MPEENEVHEKVVRLKWDTDDSLPAVYANNVIISHSGETEFHITFGHFSPPITLNLEEDEIPDVVKIKPVAKIVISPEAMRKIVEAFNTNLEKFENRIKGK